MMFLRTDGGLDSERLFYGVDFTVYCEGERSEDGHSSLDEVFWEQIFHRHGIKVKCQGRGQKRDLLQIAEEKIIGGKTSNLIVAIDRDYDDLQGDQEDHPQVIYSYGYSVESDIILSLDFSRALSLFVTLTADRQEPIRISYSEFFQRQSDELRRVFALDFKYIGHEEALFNRSRPQSIIESSDDSEPYIKVKILLDKAKTLDNSRTAPLPWKTYLCRCGVRTFFGKTVARLVFHWFVFKTKALNARKVSFQMFMNALVGAINIPNSGEPISAYYATTLERLTPPTGLESL